MFTSPSLQSKSLHHQGPYYSRIHSQYVLTCMMCRILPLLVKQYYSCKLKIHQKRRLNPRKIQPLYNFHRNNYTNYSYRSPQLILKRNNLLRNNSRFFHLISDLLMNNCKCFEKRSLKLISGNYQLLNKKYAPFQHSFQSIHSDSYQVVRVFTSKIHHQTLNNASKKCKN